jgi:hypothetical protein
MNIKTLSLTLKDEISVPLYVYGFTGQTGKKASFGISISGTVSVPSFVVKSSVAISASISADIVTPDIIFIVPVLTAYGTTDDCTGYWTTSLNNSFDSSGNGLYAGYSGGRYKAWIPFQLDFSALSPASPSLGFRITSATLKLAAYNTIEKDVTKPCKIKIGCDKTTATSTVGWSPTSWKSTGYGLGYKVMGKYYYLNTDMDSWTDETVYNFDITTAIRERTTPNYKLTGSTDNADAVTWTNGDYLATLLIDFGSSSTAYRSIGSRELANSDASYGKPTLVINCEPVFYSDVVLDSYLNYIKPTELNYNKTMIIVGGLVSQYTSKNRGFIKFNLGSIPAGVTVTDAKMYLWLESNNSINYASPTYNYRKTMYVYPFLLAGNGDLYGMSWNKKHGTAAWATTTGGFSATDCSHTSIGSVMLEYNAAVGYKAIDLDNITVEGWIDDSTTNYGMLLKMGGTASELAETDINNAHIFSSSQCIMGSHRPYLYIEYTEGGTPKTATIKVP